MKRSPVQTTFDRFRQLSPDLLVDSDGSAPHPSLPKFRFRFLRTLKNGSPELSDLFSVAKLSHFSSGIRRSNPDLSIEKRVVLYGQWLEANARCILLLERLSPGEKTFQIIANSIILPMTQDTFRSVVLRERAVIDLNTVDICGVGEKFDLLLIDTWVIAKEYRDFPGKPKHFGFGNALPLKHLGLHWVGNGEVSVYVEPDASVMGKMLQRLAFEEVGETKIGLGLYQLRYPSPSSPHSSSNALSRLLLIEMMETIQEYRSWPPLPVAHPSRSAAQQHHDRATSIRLADPQEMLSNPTESSETELIVSGFRLLPFFTGLLQERCGERPFAGLRVIFVLHFLIDLLEFVKGCEDLGLAPSLGTFFFKGDYPYPQRDKIEHWLSAKGYDVRPVDSVEEYLHKLEEDLIASSPRILIVEDGGFIAPFLHRTQSPLLTRIVGAVEQTTRGIWNTEDWSKEKTGNHVSFPILSVPDSTIKRSVEPPLIAEAVLTSIRSLADVSMSGLKAAVLGLGSIGARVARGLRSANANVIGFDSGNTSGVMSLLLDGFELSNSSIQAVKGRQLVIGCSGRTSISGEVIENLSSDVYLVSASSERIEIDHKYLGLRDRHPTRFRGPHGDYHAGHRYQLGNRQINVLADGYPVTFWHAPGMSDQGGDLVMSVILIAAAELAARNGKRNGKNAYPVGILRREVDDLDKIYTILRYHLQLYYPEQSMGRN